MTTAEEKPGGIQVIARAATIMRILGEYPQGLSLSAIATQADLARSTVQRIVQALETEGFIEPSGPEGGFQLGPLLSQLVYRKQIDIVTAVRPFLEALCAELQETVALCTVTGNSVTAIDRCIAERPLRVVFPLGTIPHPPHLLAPGRAILALLPEDQVQRVLAGSVSDGEIARELASLAKERKSGTARDTGTFISGLSGFAVPLRTHLGLHAITAILPASRTTGRQQQIFSALLDCRREIEGKIGVSSAQIA